MKKFAIAFLLIVILVLGTATIASAVTDGELDGEGHPFVGLMVAQDAQGNPLWRCSGTLLSPTLFVTAGHCTEEPAAYAVIFFTADLITPDPAFTLDTRSCVGIAGYPCAGANSYIGTDIFTHPNYDPNAFFLFDLGVVVLDAGGFVAGTYGALPGENQLDALKAGQHTGFTSVGFGLQKAFPDATAWKEVAMRQRMVSNPWLLQINTDFVGDFAIMLSNNANSGGTCFGDSGGPNFIGVSNVLAGVTSFGLNPTCGGTGGVYRVDKADDLDWLATFSG